MLINGIYFSPLTGCHYSTSTAPSKHEISEQENFEALYPKKESLRKIKDQISNYILDTKKYTFMGVSKFDFDIRRTVFPEDDFKNYDKLNFYIYDYLFYDNDFEFHFKNEEIKRKFILQDKYYKFPYDSIYVTYKKIPADKFKIYIDTGLFYKYTKRKEFYFSMKKDY